MPLLQFFNVFGNMWLSIWVDDPDAATSIPIRNKYMVVYGAMGFFQTLAVFLGVVMITIGALRASVKVCNIFNILKMFVC